MQHSLMKTVSQSCDLNYKPLASSTLSQMTDNLTISKELKCSSFVLTTIIAIFNAKLAIVAELVKALNQ